jgi:succinate dehydrogenase / fumarate reductase iron-sulfur subunit
VGDPRDGQHKERLQYLSTVQGGIWDCTRCNMCVEVCPKGVAPMDRIMQLREKAVEANVPGGIGRRHGDAFAGSIRRLGRLDEFRLLPASVGIFNVPRLLSELGGALRMFRVGKLPWHSAIPFMADKPIPGVKHVRRIMDTIRREKKAKVSQ